MFQELTDKSALVSGASRGIGRACAVALARAGCRVVACARTTEALAGVQDEIRAAGGTCDTAAFDLADKESLATALEPVLAAGGVDVLVNNAGLTDDGLLLRMSDESWERVIGTNLTGTFRLTRALLKPMVRRRWGRIVTITSVVGQTGNPGQANYAASKAGLVGFTQSLAREVGSRGITVNAVAPGYVETDMTAALTDEQRQKLLSTVPAGCMGTPADVAAGVLFLASHEAGYVTGQVLGVNGGMYM